MSHSVDSIIRIWDDVTGDRLQIEPDGDGLGMIVIVSYTAERRDGNGVTVTVEQVDLLIKALEAAKAEAIRYNSQLEKV